MPDEKAGRQDDYSGDDGDQRLRQRRRGATGQQPTRDGEHRRWAHAFGEPPGRARADGAAQICQKDQRDDCRGERVRRRLEPERQVVEDGDHPADQTPADTEQRQQARVTKMAEHRPRSDCRHGSGFRLRQQRDQRDHQYDDHRAEYGERDTPAGVVGNRRHDDAAGQTTQRGRGHVPACHARGLPGPRGLVDESHCQCGNAAESDTLDQPADQEGVEGRQPRHRHGGHRCRTCRDAHGGPPPDPIREPCPRQHGGCQTECRRRHQQGHPGRVLRGVTDDFGQQALRGVHQGEGGKTCAPQCRGQSPLDADPACRCHPIENTNALFICPMH